MFKSNWKLCEQNCLNNTDILAYNALIALCLNLVVTKTIA